METFKLATKHRLRIQTNKGLLSAEQLWDLSLEDLDTLAVALEAEYKESGKKSFLVKKTEKDKIAKLKFDLVLEVLNTKSEEAQEATEKAEIKAHNEKIIGLIAEKRDEALSKKSIKELEAMLK